MKLPYTEQLQEVKMMIDKHQLELKTLSDQPHKEAKDYLRVKWLDEEIENLHIKKRQLLNLI